MRMHANLDWLHRYSTVGFASTCHITAQCLVEFITGCFSQQALNAITILLKLHCPCLHFLKSKMNKPCCNISILCTSTGDNGCHALLHLRIKPSRKVQRKKQQQNTHKFPKQKTLSHCGTVQPVPAWAQCCRQCPSYGCWRVWGERTSPAPLCLQRDELEGSQTDSLQQDPSSTKHQSNLSWLWNKNFICPYITNPEFCFD